MEGKGREMERLINESAAVMKGLGTVGEHSEFMLCGSYSFQRKKVQKGTANS